VNAAAYTDVRRAESDFEAARQMNEYLPGLLAAEARRLGAIYLDYSTDYVFDGANKQHYLETDAPGPLNAYGRSKLAGERAIQAAGGASFIFRTSWVYSLRGKNFYLTIVRLAQAGQPLRVINDQFGCPTWAREIAQVTRTVCSSLFKEKDWRAAAQATAGLYHYAAAGQTTWYDFASAILASEPGSVTDLAALLSPIAAVDYPDPVQRPQYSVLASQKLRQTFGLIPRSWVAQLAECRRSPIPGRPPNF